MMVKKKDSETNDMIQEDLWQTLWFFKLKTRRSVRIFCF